MRTDLSALLQSVKENPADDTARYVLADWLEENGNEPDRARAELIRVQCRIARQTPNDPERLPLEGIEQRLLQEHLPAWLEGLPARMKDAPPGALKGSPYFRCGCTIERGLARPWFATGQPWLDEVPPDSPAWDWVDGLRLVDVRPLELKRIVASPILGQLNFLSLGPDGWAGWTDDRPIGSEGAFALVSAPHLTRLTHLDLSDCGMGADGAKALAESPRFGRLTHLDLGGFDCTESNHIGDAGARAIAESPYLGGLTDLNLMWNGIRAEGTRALLTSPRLARLTSLDLSWPEPSGIFGPPRPERDEKEWDELRELYRKRFG